MKKITKEDLRAGNACPDQIALFEQHYPNGISVCRYCAQEAQNKGLQVSWLIRSLPWGEDYRFISLHTRIKRLKKPIVAYVNGVPYTICRTGWVDELGLVRLERVFLKKRRMVEPCTK